MPPSYPSSFDFQNTIEIPLVGISLLAWLSKFHEVTPLRPGVCVDVANIHDFDGPSKPSDTTQRAMGLSIRFPI